MPVDGRNTTILDDPAEPPSRQCHPGTTDGFTNDGISTDGPAMIHTALDEELASLIESAASGDGEAFDDLVARLYDQLRAIAHGVRRPTDPLTTTALVSEAYIRLKRTFSFKAATLPYFLSSVKVAMRRILVEHSVAQKRQKRGGAWTQTRTALDQLVAQQKEVLGVEPLDFFEALEALEKQHPEWFTAVCCGYLLGLSSAEAGRHFGSEPTFRKKRALGVRWLKQRLGYRDAPASGTIEG